MARHVAHKKAEELVTVRERDRKIATDAARSAEEGFNDEVVPYNTLRCKRLLHPLREFEFALRFFLALFEQGIRLAKPFLDTFLRTDVGRQDQRVLASVRGLNDSRAVNYRSLLAVLARHIELVAVVAVAIPNLFLPHYVGQVR
jgi:hypothetical protein